MAQKYYNTQETAQILGVSEDDVKKMLDGRDLHGYRDGADWKFKAEDIDNLAKQRQTETPPSSEEEEGDDVLLSEVALGQSDLGTSGTVIGMNGVGVSTGESDIQLAGSSIILSDTSQTPPAIGTDEVDSKVSQFEKLDLSLDDDLTLGGSTGVLPGKTDAESTDPGGSAIDLSGRDLDDDDLVLGGSGKGSDVTIGGDSGISLIDPADSGLSLEQPLDLAGGSDESLELGEEDLLAVGEGGSSPTELKTDDDFLLTPLEEGADLDESESGSQVIALDTEGDDAAAMIGDSAQGSMAAMLDEDLSQPGLDMGMESPLAGTPMLDAQPGGLSEGATLMHPSAALAEPPYTGWQIAGLATCTALLMLCGMLMFDILRNMWSWDGPYTVNSSLMDMIVGLFE